MFPTPTPPVPQGGTQDPLAAVFQEYLANQAANNPNQPAQQPVNPNVTIPIKGQPMQFPTPEAAGQVFDTTISQYEQQLAQLNQQYADLQSRYNSQLSQPAPQIDNTKAKPLVDPEAWAKATLEDPAKGLDLAIEHSEKFKKMEAKFNELDRRDTLNNFVSRHPVFANQQALSVIGNVHQQMGLQVTEAHLEAALAVAQQRGMLPNEQMLVQQTQMAQMQKIQQYNQPNPSIGGYENSQQPQQFQQQFQPPVPQNWGAPPQFQQNAPPPSPGRMNTSQSVGSPDLTQLASTMPLDKLGELIAEVQRRGGY